jgi:hypothetical protein
LIEINSFFFLSWKIKTALLLLKVKICAKKVEEIYQKQWIKSTSGIGKEIRESRVEPGQSLNVRQRNPPIHPLLSFKA